MRFQHFVAATLIVSSSLASQAVYATIDRFSEVTPEIYRGGQPETVADFQKLKDLGIRTVISLREEDPTWERGIVTKLGMQFEEFPINPFSYPSEKTVNAVLAAIYDPKLQPVFIHCQHGKDRTGLIIGLHRVHQENWTPTKAYKEMKSFGFSSFLLGLKRYFDDHT